MDFIFVSLGSKGNATLFRQGETIVQIDMGVTLKAVRNALSTWGKTIKDISALFLTHEHNDHISGLDLYHERIPVFAGKGTCSLPKERYLREGEAIEIGDITVMPFSSSHDATNPHNFILLAGGKKFGYVTDTGYVKPTGLRLLRDCDYYLMESNYDVDMLMTGPYPPFLKKRIHGQKGHLSNIDSARACASVIGPKTKAIYLGHLSDENNTPEKAEATYRQVFIEAGVNLERIHLQAIPQKTTVFGGDHED